ncbi:MAG: hypothetical protein ACKOPM_10935 [Novosphingobium sp.]
MKREKTVSHTASESLCGPRSPPGQGLRSDELETLHPPEKTGLL